MRVNSSIRIAHTMSPPSAPFYVASELGLWEEHGLNAKAGAFFSTQSALASLLSGDSDVAVVADSNLTAAAHARQRLMVLGRFAKSSGHVWCVVRKDHGITHVADLVRKKIGVAFGTNAELYLNQVISSHGVSLNQGEKIDLTPTDAVLAFRSGAISAAVGWEPQVSQMLSMGPSFADVLKIETSTEYRFSLVTTFDYVNRRPHGIRALYATVENSIDYFETHSSECFEFVARRTAMSREAFVRVSPFYTFHLEEPEVVRLPASREGKNQRRAPAWLKHAGQYVHDGFLEKISLSDVARESGFHPIHVSRMFQQMHGCSVGEFVRALRLDWCARRLVQSNESIAGIANEAGFADQAHFSRQFRQHTGLTPKAFRSAMLPSFFKSR